VSREVYLEYLPVAKRVLGPDHALTLNANLCYGMFLSSCSHLVESEAILVDNVEAQKRFKGAQHPNTLMQGDLWTVSHSRHAREGHIRGDTQLKVNKIKYIVCDLHPSMLCGCAWLGRRRSYAHPQLLSQICNQRGFQTRCEGRRGGYCSVDAWSRTVHHHHHHNHI
jgi:hypothetical protein